MRSLFFLRSLVSTVVFIVFTITVASIVVVAVFFNRKQLQNQLIEVWGRGSALIYFIKLKCTGLENIPKGGCLFLFTHSSYFDILVLAAFIKKIRFGAKIELFKIPIFGRAMSALGTLPIARKNRNEVLKVYEEAKSRIYHGEKFALSPEGGRQNSERIYPFKAGPFILAIQTKAPVVPVAILGAFNIHSNTDLIPHTRGWISTIHMYILPAISTQDLEESDKSELQQEVKQSLSQYISVLG